MKESLLSGINSPLDLKKKSTKALYALAREIRREIVDVVLNNGGHLASNLGVVELTLVLHRIFHSPKDKIIWDVGHQCYTHKLVTGRKNLFNTIRKKDGLSGFPKRSESIHDIAETGHSSTSISSGLGILTAQNIQNIEGKVIAVIGDGALTGGMAFEALNHTGHLKKNLIIVVNDNNMSIGPNIGALSSSLSRLTITTGYQRFRKTFDQGLETIPVLGKRILNIIIQLKKGIKAVFFKENIFSDLGFEYVGPIDGHNISVMSRVFSDVKKINKPVVVHVRTRKGRGYQLAETDPVFYHGVSPVSYVDGKVEKKINFTYTKAFSNSLVEMGLKDQKIVAITAAMAGGTGLEEFQRKFPGRFFDVGITEQHAVTFASGLAIAGLKPVVAIYSTFMQRAVDQVIHDVALPSLPVVFALDRAGFVGGDGETHQGIFDIALFRSIPGITILAPASSAEVLMMLEYGLNRCNAPVIIRYPKDTCPEIPVYEKLIRGRGVFLEKQNNSILFISVGGCIMEVQKATEILAKNGIGVDLYNLRFVKPLDEAYLMDVISHYKRVFMFEDGIRTGGIGEYIASLVNTHKNKLDFEYYGSPNRFIPQAARKELFSDCGLDAESIAVDVSKTLRKGN